MFFGSDATSISLLPSINWVKSKWLLINKLNAKRGIFAYLYLENRLKKQSA